MPLPPIDPDSDKDDRGRVLVVGGSVAVPGAVLLSGLAALRAGAGKVQIATASPAAIPLGVAIPEAMVVGLPVTRAGEIAGSRSITGLRDHAEGADAMLIGPGISSGPAARALVRGLIPRLGAGAALVLDAGSLQPSIGEIASPLAGGRCVLTPHTGEMATLLQIEKSAVERDLPGTAARAARRFGAVVVLKSAETWIAEPDGALFHFRGGGVGLATSGSGDVLAGAIAGLLARGAGPLTAAVWGVWAHGMAGRAVARRIGPVGFLARELLAELPGLVASVQ
jgi:ADP-dependent NAD(P)H-hydrate dehydratase